MPGLCVCACVCVGGCVPAGGRAGERGRASARARGASWRKAYDLDPSKFYADAKAWEPSCWPGLSEMAWIPCVHNFGGQVRNRRAGGAAISAMDALKQGFSGSKSEHV